MARSQIYIVLVSMVLLVSACEKAKMRTVPRKAPDTTAAAPTTEAPVEAGTEGDVKVTETKVETVNAPLPKAPESIANLGEVADVKESSSGEKVLSAPAPVSEKTVSHKSSETKLVDDGPAGEIADACCEKPAPAPKKIVKPLPAPRPAPRKIVRQNIPVREMEQVKKDDLECRWEPTGSPAIYLRYNPSLKLVIVENLFTKKVIEFTNVKMLESDKGPLGVNSIVLVSKDMKAIAHIKHGQGKLTQERDTTYPYEALYGVVPGGPKGERSLGACWTKSEPAVVGGSNQ